MSGSSSSASTPAYVPRRTPIRKPPHPWRVEPNLADYTAARSAFSWESARCALDGLPGGRGLNIAYEAVDRHAMGPRASSVAIRWLGRAGQRQDVTYDELRRQTGRFANLLQRRGVRKGEVVATLMGRVPALYAAALGTLKNGSVYTPLFSAFGPDPIVVRLTKARARVLVTTTSLYQRKVLPVRALLPDLEHVLLVRDGAAAVPDGADDLAALMLDQDDTFEIPPTDPQDLAYGTKMRVIVVIEAPERKGQPARCEIFKRPADFLAPCGL